MLTGPPPKFNGTRDILSMDRWRTYRRDGSAPTPPGSCAPRSPTTCCALPACWPVTSTPVHGDRRYAAKSSTPPLDWPAHDATDPAPARSLALVETLAPAVAQHDRIQPTNHDLTPTTRRTRPYRHHKCSGAASCPARPGIELARVACVGAHGPLSPLDVGQGRRLLEV
jgi:hypothetical protein